MKVRYAMGGILVAALLALPASAAAAGQGGQVSGVAAQQCAKQRAELGKRAFRKRYGAKHAMRNCIKRNRAKATSTLTSAAQDCQEELAQLGADEFILDYTLDEDTVENAMSECVADTIEEILYPSDDGPGDDEDF